MNSKLLFAMVLASRSVDCSTEPSPSPEPPPVVVPACVAGDTRRCTGGCNNTQECKAGEWGACVARCAAGMSCSGDNLQTTGIGFDDQQDRLVVPAAAYPNPKTYSFATWLRVDQDRDTLSAVFTIEQPAGHSVEWNEIATANDGTTLAFHDVNGTACTFGAVTPGEWVFLAATVAADGSLACYLAHGNGALVRTNGMTAHIDHVEMSYLGSSNFTAVEYFNGSMAMSRLWNAVLTEAEVDAERHAIEAVRTSALLGDWPLRTAESASTDISGNVHTLGLNLGRTHTTVTGPTLSGGAATCH